MIDDTLRPGPSGEFEPELEAAIKKGFRETMEYLHADVPKERLGPLLSSLKGQGGDEALSADATAKAEANAIAGYFLERPWRIGKPRVQAGRLGLYFRRIEDKKIVWHPASAKSLAKAAGSSPRIFVESIVKAMDHTFRPLVDREVKSMELKLKLAQRSKEPEERWPDEVRFYSRYKKRLAQMHERTTEGEKTKPDVHIKAGFGTALTTTWAIMDAIPSLYHGRFSMGASPDELNKMLDAGRELALYLAARVDIGHFTLVRDVILESRNTQQEGRDIRLPLPFFNRGVLYLKEQNGGYLIDVKEDALREIVRRAKRSQETHTGCPAVVARGTDGQNVVVELYDEVRNLANKYYFPMVLKQG